MGEESDMDGHDTIFALASGAGRAAVAVMRISEPATDGMLRALTGRPPPAPRRASLRRLRDQDGGVLDQALVLWMPAPASYTGEASAELHLHAGPAVLDGVAAALATLGARPAEPGEFTRRAFCNGRMALTEAEGIADLIAAETEAQRIQALRQLEGALGRLFDGWSTRVHRLLAEQEAQIDFPDEAAEASFDGAEARSLIDQIETQLADEHRGERLRRGLVFAVSGPPNAGKSSLVNALAGREAAIVSPVAGTTRDVIEVRTVFGGVPVVLLDTAGLRDSDDAVEAEGVRRARAAAAEADLVLMVEESGGGSDIRPDKMGPPRTVLIASKIDLAPPSPHRLGVSVTTGAGLQELRHCLDEAARDLTQRAGPPPLTRARHRAACLGAVEHLRASIAAPAMELRAEELRLAMHALGRVTGRVGVEQVLDSVFSQFCIGK